MSARSSLFAARDRLAERCFSGGLYFLFALYAGLIVAMLVADTAYADWDDLKAALTSPDIQASIALTLVTCFVSALLAVLVAVPVGYLLSRYRVPGKVFLDAVLDIPIVLPPLVVGLSLLILFNSVHFPGGGTLEDGIVWLCKRLPFLRDIPNPGVTYKVPAVILAQFTVCAAFAVRTMRTAFDDLSPRAEQVALTLGCHRGQAFWWVALPESWNAVIAAGMLAWARALGEFGPILVFAGATRGRTEVLSTTVFLEISVANIEAAVAVSLLMVGAALCVLVGVRLAGVNTLARRVR